MTPVRLRFHQVRTLLWAANLPFALVTGLTSSVTYVSMLSVAALVESSATDWDQARQAARHR